VIEVRVSAEIRSAAEERASRITSHRTVTSHKNYTGLELDGRYTQGSLGELVVERYLESLHIWFKSERPVGRSDNFDFVIDHYRVGRIFVDVKSSKDDGDMLINAAQFERAGTAGPSKAYVGVVLGRDNALIRGYITSREVPRFPLRKLKSPAYCVPYEELRPMEALLKHCRKVGKAWSYRLPGGGGGTFIPGTHLDEDSVRSVLTERHGVPPEFLER